MLAAEHSSAMDIDIPLDVALPGSPPLKKSPFFPLVIFCLRDRPLIQLTTRKLRDSQRIPANANPQTFPLSLPQLRNHLPPPSLCRILILILILIIMSLLPFVLIKIQFLHRRLRQLQLRFFPITATTARTNHRSLFKFNPPRSLLTFTRCTLAEQSRIFFPEAFWRLGNPDAEGSLFILPLMKLQIG